MGSNPILDNYNKTMFTKYIFNRPVSPHLTIYLPQVSSLFSIWHRITGVVLTIFILSPFLFLDLVFNFEFPFLFNLYFSYWFILFYYLFFSSSFIYHSLNGVRHLLWDLKLFLKLHFLYPSSIVILLFLFIITTKIIITF